MPTDPATPASVEFTSELSPLVLAQVLAAATVANPLMLTLMLSGPMFLVLGALMKGAMLLQWGYTLLIALPAVPLVSFAFAYVNAHRSASRDLLTPVRVRADERGLDLEVGEERRKADWRDFSRWRRLAGAHLLYTAPRTFMILRPDALDADSLAAFESLLRANIPSGPRR